MTERVVDWAMGLAIVMVLAFVVLMGFCAWEDAKQWAAFKEEHACKKVGEMSGDLVNTVGISPNGQLAIGVGTTSSKTGWACDDGVTYWR